MPQKANENGKNYRWFLQPLNDHTNEAIARALIEKAAIVEISQWPTIDDRSVMVWECPFEVINAFVRSKGQGIKFNIYNCSDRQKVIRKCDWLTKKKKTKSPISKGIKPKTAK